ncbi:MAG: hypothetical protein ACR2P1_05760, partial [Pseudomonadales bacterium]
MAPPITSNSIGPMDFSHPAEPDTRVGQDPLSSGNPHSSEGHAGMTHETGGSRNSAVSALANQNAGTPVKTEPSKPSGPPGGNPFNDPGNFNGLEPSGFAPELEVSVGINTPFGNGKVSHTASDGNTKASVETPGIVSVEVDPDDGSTLKGKIPGGINVSADDKGKVSAEVELDVPVGPFGGVIGGGGVNIPANNSGDPTTVTVKAGGRVGPTGLNVQADVAFTDRIDDPFDVEGVEPVNRISPEPAGTKTRVDLFTGHLSGPEITGKLPEQPTTAGAPSFAGSQLIDFASLSNTPNLGVTAAPPEQPQLGPAVEPHRFAFKPDVFGPPAPQILSGPDITGAPQQRPQLGPAVDSTQPTGMPAEEPSFADNVKSLASGAWQSVKQGIGWLGDKIQQIAQEDRPSILESRDAAMGIQSYSAKEAFDGVTGTLGNVGKSIADTASSIGSSISDIGSSIADTASGIGSSISDTASDIGSSISDAASSVGSSISDAASSVGSAISDAASSFADAVGLGSDSDDDNGGSDSGGSSRVICTYFYQKGELARGDWAADLRFTRNNLSEQTVRGYHAWAIPTVRLMRSESLAGRM